MDIGSQIFWRTCKLIGRLLCFRQKTALLVDTFVILKILSMEYQSYACGKIFRAPRSQPKMPGLGMETTQATV
jgi:hypothetical protein